MHRIIAAVFACLLVLTFVAPVAAEGGATTDGLTMINSGAAAYYAAGYDGAGWDRIRRITAANTGQDASAVYDRDGYYCVKIGFSPGNLLTLRNPTTGRSARCMVADTNAPQDNAVWLSRWVVEVSFNLFQYLGLNERNSVEVYVMEGG